MRNAPVVLHVLTALDFGGVERRMEMLAEATADGSRYEHRFCALGGGGAASAFISGAGCRVDCLAMPVKIPSTRLIVKLVQLMRATRPVIVHTHGAEANFHGLIAASLARVPVRVAEEIGIPTHSRLAKFVFRTVYSRANYVIGMSDGVVRKLIDSNEVPFTKAITLFNPIKCPPSRTGLPSPDRDRIQIGFLGRLESVKNPLGLLRAFGRLASENDAVDLLFVGHGSLYDEMNHVVREQGLEQRVTISGYQRHPFETLANCDLFVQSSITEGFSVALVEALGFGLPAIATNTGGTDEVIIPGETGWVIKPNDEDALYAAMRDGCSRSRFELHDMGMRARKSVLNRFDPRDYVRKLEELYARADRQGWIKR